LHSGGSAAIPDDKRDALRHGIWGTYVGKYACTRYGSVNEAASVITGFLDSHECNQNSVSSSMDKHNNVITVGYYILNTESYNAGFLNNNTRVNKTDEVIANEINGKGFVQASNTISSVQSAASDKLVYVNDNN
jgi:hypothetical protein